MLVVRLHARVKHLITERILRGFRREESFVLALFLIKQRDIIIARTFLYIPVTLRLLVEEILPLMQVNQ